MSDDDKELDVSYGFIETEENDTVKDTQTYKAPYVKNDDKATDYRYAGALLTVFGGLGMVLVVLIMMKVLPRFLGSGYLSYGVLFALCILFFVMGILSAKNAGGFEKKAKSDNLLEKRVIDFVGEEITAEKIDEAAGIYSDDEPEIMYFKRTDLLKRFINNKFVNIDPDFLDALIDEKLYDMIFEDKEE